jgi:ABC-type Fe3+/spermidine/putrescine transport system ATPase subunit
VKGRLDREDAGRGVVHLGPLQRPVPHRDLPAGEVDVVIRPEAIRLVPPDTAGCLPATIRTATYMGAHAEYNLETEAGPLFCIAPEAHALRSPGAPVGVMLADRGVFAVKP